MSKFSLEELEVLERKVRGWSRDGEIEGIPLIGSEKLMFWGTVRIENVFFGVIHGITMFVGHYETIAMPPLGSDVYRIEARIGKILLGRKEAGNGRIKSIYEGVKSRYEKRADPAERYNLPEDIEETLMK